MEAAPLSIHLVQANLQWENREKNFLHFERFFYEIEAADVVVLPEMFTSGFSMNISVADENEESLNWMKNMSRKFNFTICGSVMVKQGKELFNRFYWVEPNGIFSTYDKKHLFRMAGENNFFSGGKERLIIDFKGWKICPMVCYDLRFPGWSRNQSLKSNETNLVYDILLYVANWPQKRSLAWKTLLAARAIENSCFCIGVNRVGEDGNNIPYSGNSGIIDPTGIWLGEAMEGKEGIIKINLFKKALVEFRQQFPSWKDADNLMLE